MLLPSDIARLVLGYLQQEGLSSTSRAFILESPNLKEYAEHCTEDGLIPACVFSLFGKNLKTVLNEYVAVKTKEMSQENQVPAMFTSLWKKLDVTLNQIRCMQNSPIVYSSQRMRTKNGILRHRALQKSLLSASPGAVSDCVSAPSPCVSSPMATPQVAPAHSTPVCVSPQQPRPSPLALSQPHIQDGSRLSISQIHNTPLQVIVPDQRFNPGPLSPARRKCDSPRRRGGCLAAGSGSTRLSMVPSSLIQEGQSEEVVSENFPQMVIENAREKILKDRSLQEKLAENINKILASDSPQASKAASSSVDHDQSIDEILGLQGEIHMTDDAIQDILEQTESDPAFQALFDLFDYGKSKAGSAEEVEHSQRYQDCEDITCTEESTDVIKPSPVQLDSTSCAQPFSAPRSKTRGAEESKSKRKSVPSSSSASRNPTSTVPPAPTPSQLASENQALGRGFTILDPKQRGSKRHTQATQHASQADRSAAMEEVENREVDDNFASAEMDLMPLMQVQPETDASQSAEELPVLADRGQLLVATSDLPLSSPASGNTAETDGPHELVQEKGALCRAGKTPQLLDRPLTNKGVVRESDQSEKQAHLSDVPVKSQTQGGEAVQKLHVPDEVTWSEVSSVTSSTHATSLPATVSASPVVMESDPSQIVSLKIIVSDEQERSSTDAMLSQAVSSIADECLPTIYLSSPARSPARGVLLPPMPSSRVTSEEMVQAVNCLHNTEQPIPANADGPQEPGFFQLFPATAGSNSYFVVADQMVSGDCRSSVVVVPGAPAAQGQVNTLPKVVATPPRPQAVPQSYGSTFIISSPVQSMLQSVVVPVSVMGQNNTGKLTVPNQVISLPCRTSLTQPALVAKPKLTTRPDISNPGEAFF
ncbi:hypothetical protein ACEWY4_007662 [Coilia grayii]|uniref:Protein NPAT C-terminal domain-containing protein n=1 Tax=Coilia grayii TaxID=363190 RepID=A0ABD1K8V3_9TELE